MICVFILLAVLAWLAIGLSPHVLSSWLAKKVASEESIRIGGTFGDGFGAANALFSALAFAAVAYSLMLQRRELHESRVEADRMRLLHAEMALIGAKANVNSSLAAYFSKEVRQEDSAELHRELVTVMTELMGLRREIKLKISAIRAMKEADPSIGDPLTPV